MAGLLCSSLSISFPLFFSEWCVLLLVLAVISIVSSNMYSVLLLFSLKCCNCYSWSCVCPSSEWFFHGGFPHGNLSIRAYYDFKSLFSVCLSYTSSTVLVIQINHSRCYLASFIVVCIYKQSYLLIYQIITGVLWSSPFYSHGRLNKTLVFCFCFWFGVVWVFCKITFGLVM